jgi:pimeloyl-ACP methyl ester carboxylesterase
LLLGCFSLDSFLFEPVRVTGAYLNSVDMDSTWQVRFVIPDTLIQPVTLTSQGKTIYGFFVLPNGTDTAATPTTVIYSHGKFGNINRYWGRLEMLWEMGYQVFIYDYQGYGKSEGTPSGPGCFADAEAALAYCLSRDDVDSSRIVYYGWSLGTYMTCHLAADIRPPAAVILESPLASTSSITREGTVLDVPGSFVVRADFDNERRIGRVGAPLLMLHGRQDEVAVFERNALVLYGEANQLATEYVWVDNAIHDNVPYVMGSDYARVIKDFVYRAGH